MGFINRTPSPLQEPPLIDLPRVAWDNNQLVPFIPLNTSEPSEDHLWVTLIINNRDDRSHPFHLHGHDFYVFASHRSDTGWGSYKGATFPPILLPDDPNFMPGSVSSVGLLRKDTVMVPRRGYVMNRFRADNAGIWMFHRHLRVHLGIGMAMGFQVGSEL